MNEANLSTYVYQGKKKSTQFPEQTHTGYTADPHQGYIIENQPNTTHNRDTWRTVEVLLWRANTHKIGDKWHDWGHNGGRILGKGIDLLNIASLIVAFYRI